MSYCGKCGKFIYDEKIGCTYCNVDIKKSEQNKVYTTKNTDELVLSNNLKVLITTITVLIPIVGIIFGLFFATVYMNRHEKDYKSFGNALLALSIFMIVVNILLCAILFLLNFILFEGLLNDVPNIYYDNSGLWI